MSVEKSYNEFILIHERKIMSNDVASIEKDIKIVSDRALDVIGNGSKNDISEATKLFNDGLKALKKVLTKHGIYEI